MAVPSSIDSLEGLARSFGLHFVRVLSMLAFVPIFGPNTAAKMMKVGLSLVLTFAAFTLGAERSRQDPGEDPIRICFLALTEVSFGLLLGFCAAMIFEAGSIAGNLIATEMGLNMASQVDPVTQQNQPLLTHLFQSMGYLLFFMAGGHKLLLAALVGTFSTVPVGEFAFDASLIESVVRFSTAVLLGGLRMAAPIFFLLIVLTLIIAFLAKVAPQLHIVEASYPIRILGAFTFIIAFMPHFVNAFDVVLDELGLGFAMIAQGAP